MVLVFGRKKDDVTTAEPLEEQANGSHVVRPGAKNRPTPKRREQEAARRKPVVDPDRKKASSRDRATSREDARAQREAMMRGEEWALFERDRGVFRRFARDFVDARFNVGELLMPMILTALILSWVMTATKIEWLFYVVFALTYGVFAVAIVDAVLAYRRLKASFTEKHPRETIPSGSGMYAGMRMMQIRRLRTPRPQVARGEFPR